MLASTLVTGGAERVVLSLALGLAGSEVRPYILCLHGPGKVGEELAARGIPVFSNLAESRFDPRIAARLAGRLRKESTDILFCLDHHDAVFWGALASKLAGVRRRVLSIHSTRLWGKSSSFTISDRMALPFYDRIVALAETHADYLERNEGIERSRIEVIHNGVDIQRYRPPASQEERKDLRRMLGLPESSFVTTIVAALRPEKNHDMLLRSAAELGGNAECLFMIVGGGGEEARLRDLAGRLSLEKAVRFMGEREDIPEILSASDLFVLCSHPVVETFPLSVLEAMSAGLPVVSTRVGSIHIIINDGEEGILIDPGDQEALTKSIRLLMRDEPRRKIMGGRGRSAVENRFSLEKMIDSYAALFAELLPSLP
jgi:glycosyltransferase involved in cell wall biosynthesis